MSPMDRQMYEAPSIDVFEVIQAGVTCISETGTEGSPAFNPFNNEVNW